MPRQPAARHDDETPSAPAAARLARLKAPGKRIFGFEPVAHEMQQDQPGTVFLRLVQDIRPIAARAGDAAPDDAPGVE